MHPVALILTILVAIACSAGVASADANRCGAPPRAAGSRFRHLRSRVVTKLGEPHHRGIDLISSTSAQFQTLAGKLAYGKLDKDLEDEDVEIFACSATGWQRLGTTRSDGDGQFSLVLAGANRLAAGLHDLAFTVVGDRSGARFVGLVAPEHAKLIVSDVDGTLTASERAYWATVAWHKVAGVQPKAASVLTAAAAKGYHVVYVTARGGQFTEDTRNWLAANGFPAGPLRLAPTPIVIPGRATVEFKSAVLTPLATSFDLVAGIGNRASDIAAYTAAGIPADRIFIKLPEFTDELTVALTANQAVGFADYDDLVVRVAQLPTVP